METEYSLQLNEVEKSIPEKQPGDNFLSSVQSNRVRYFAERLYKEFDGIIEKYDRDIVINLLPIIVKILSELDIQLAENREKEAKIDTLKEEKKLLFKQYEREKRLRKSSEESMFEMECAAEELKGVEKQLVKLGSKLFFLNKRVDNVYGFAIHLDEALSQLQTSVQQNDKGNVQSINDTIKYKVCQAKQSGSAVLPIECEEGYSETVNNYAEDTILNTSVSSNNHDEEINECCSTLSLNQAFLEPLHYESMQSSVSRFTENSALCEDFTSCERKGTQADFLFDDDCNSLHRKNHCVDTVYRNKQDKYNNTSFLCTEEKELPPPRELSEICDSSPNTAESDPKANPEVLNIGSIFAKAASAIKYLAEAGDVNVFVEGLRRECKTENAFCFTTRQLLETLEKLEAEISDVKGVLRGTAEEDGNIRYRESVDRVKITSELESQKQEEEEAIILLNAVNTHRNSYHVKHEEQGFSIRKLFGKVHRPYKNNSNCQHSVSTEKGNIEERINTFNKELKKLKYKELFYGNGVSYSSFEEIRNDRASLYQRMKMLPGKLKSKPKMSAHCPLMAYYLPMKHGDTTWKFQCATGVNFSIESSSWNGNPEDKISTNSLFSVRRNKSSIVWLCETNQSGSRVSTIDGANPRRIIDMFLLNNVQVTCVTSAPSKFIPSGTREDVLPDAAGWGGNLDDVPSSLAMTKHNLKEIITSPVMWMGCNDGSIYMYEVSEEIKGARFVVLDSPVLCILYANDKLFAGREDGKLSVFERNSHEKWNANFAGFKLLSYFHYPVSRVVLVHNHLWCSSFDKVHIIDAVSCKTQGIIKTCQREKKRIHQLAGICDVVALSFETGTVVKLYHAATHYLLQNIDIRTTVHKLPQKYGLLNLIASTHITTMLATKTNLWIGMGNGNIMIIPIHNTEEIVGAPYCKVADALLCTYRHHSDVSFIISISGNDKKYTRGENSKEPCNVSKGSNRNETKPIFVISGGRGFVEHCPGLNTVGHKGTREAKVTENYIIGWQLQDR